jgi:hypothetical protein
LPTGAEATYVVSDPTNSNSNVFANITPLQTNQNMYIVFTVGTALKGCVWVNGSTTWQNTAGSSCINGANTDAIATVTSGVSTNLSSTSTAANFPGYVFLAYIDSSGHTVFQEYASGAWQTAVTLDSNSGNTYVTTTYYYVNGSSDYVVVYWIRSGTIYTNAGIEPYASGNWQGSATAWKTGTNLTNLTAVASANATNPVFAEWTSDASAPYTVNWASFTVPENMYLMIGFIPLMSYFIKRKRKSSAEVRRKC